MSPAPLLSQIPAAIRALQAFDRDAALGLLHVEFRNGPSSGDRWRSVAMLTRQIGEIELTIEASRRYARTEPFSLERLLALCEDLAAFGRDAEIAALVAGLPPAVQEHPAILHLRATLASEMGAFDTAEGLYRQVLDRAPAQPATWLALAMIKRFHAGDPDLAALEQAERALAQAPAPLRARLRFARGKALDDCGDTAAAFRLYAESGRLRASEAPYDPEAVERQTARCIADFTPEGLARLAPPRQQEKSRALFVHGLPRSGTTLVEQILAAHSAVADGGEINLMGPALLATGDRSLAGALAYQAREADKDPWGRVRATYHRLLAERFPVPGHVVDKTLNQSHLLGLQFHTLPDARLIWIRRDPEDNALSCLRTFFNTPLPWSWTPERLARHFRQEDRLFAHWQALFPDRILAVPYEDLVRDPTEWIPRIAAHAGLAVEPGQFSAHQAERRVGTASVQQVRGPISTASVGRARPLATLLKPFSDAYRT
ncbi:tetratricopeptide repeat-containing sulfotransferase family protein [Sphingomonas elodea]|uniref:tetratricopeptide repeat-containing sulfotransferase family protein n=1 Tax=Sphingomonas elodea TaxID=179878 RepID=UPI0002632162|nr:sulfotransferase [Sphingomonas elodea]